MRKRERERKKKERGRDGKERARFSNGKRKIKRERDLTLRNFGRKRMMVSV